MTETLDCTRYTWYCPPDPGWADREVVGKIRSALKRLDSKLNFWWCPEWKADDPKRPGRWAVVYWMARAVRWSTVFYLEDAGGGFKPASMECIEPILKTLHECDTERKGRDVYSIDEAAAKIAESKERKRKEEFREVMLEHARSYGRRLAGMVTIGPGGPRKRKGLGPDADFEKFLQERGIR